MRRFVGIILLSAAILQLGFRGMQRVRSEVPMWDFASVYAATRTWMHGGNPYNRPQVIATWKSAGAFADRDVSYFATVYPPSSLLFLLPVAPLPPIAAMAVWLLITLALIAIQFVLLANMAKIPWSNPLALILLGGSLASAPFQFGILSGQLSMPAISICIASFWCVGRNKRTMAGLLLGIACALKPQVGGPFLAYYIVLRYWRVVIPAIICGGLITAASLIAMHLSHIDWLDGWTQSIAATQVVGGVNDYGWAGYFRDEIVDLKMLLVSIVHNQRVLRLTIQCIVLALGCWYVWAFPKDEGRVKSQNGPNELLLLAGLAALSLLPIYHRIYDVALLTTGLAWALANFDSARRTAAIASIVPMLIFLIPFDCVRAVGRRITGLSDFTSSGAYQSVIEPYYAWALFAVTIVILVIMSRTAHVSADTDD